MRFGYDRDGGLGDRLLAAVLRGEKTATSSLAVEYLRATPSRGWVSSWTSSTPPAGSTVKWRPRA
ncbi:MAG: hypothetical protein M3P96_07880 [Actinomycetota bacterium]|nr:hypothetical protein [Actinomycetota bacterium]